MDVPTRQSYTMAVVDPDERSAAAGVTGIARSLGVGRRRRSIAAPAAHRRRRSSGLPFVIAGALKIVYDLLLYRRFRPSARPRSACGAPDRARAPVAGLARGPGPARQSAGYRALVSRPG